MNDSVDKPDVSGDFFGMLNLNGSYVMCFITSETDVVAVGEADPEIIQEMIIELESFKAHLLNQLH